VKSLTYFWPVGGPHLSLAVDAISKMSSSLASRRLQPVEAAELNGKGKATGEEGEACQEKLLSPICRRREREKETRTCGFSGGG